MKSRHGQAINIDYTIGLGVFLISLLSGVLLAANANLGDTAVVNARQQASLVQDELRDATFHRGRQAPLIVRTPARTGRVPVDTGYVFPERAYPGSGAMDVAADVRIDENRVITVVNGKNASHQLSYFYSNKTNLTYSNRIQTGSWMNNTEIAVKPGSPGIQSLRVTGNEVLNPDADLNGNSFSIIEEELHAKTLSGDLKLYNGTRELILENPGTVTFNMKNFTTLYWHRDRSTTELTGTGTFKSGNTSGFTVATYQGNDYGVTFLGDELDATVSKPDSSTVRATIDAPRLRIYLHDSNYSAGKRRAEFFTSGKLVFGAEEKLAGASRKKIEELEDLEDSRIAEILNVGSYDFNITYGQDNPVLHFISEISSQREWNTGTFTGTSADRSDNSGDLGIGYLNGTKSGQPNDNGLNNESLLLFYRLDRDVDGSTGTVIDYSGEKSDGAYNGGATTGKQGVFGTNATHFDGTDDSIDTGVDNKYDLIAPVTVSAWVWIDSGHPDLSNQEFDVFGKYDGSGWIFRHWSGGFEWWWEGTNHRSKDFTPPREDWQMWTAVHNTTHIIYYRNGTQFDVVDAAGDLKADSANTLKLMQRADDAKWAEGKIDKPRIINRSLSTSEVRRLYHLGRDGEFNGNYTSRKIDNKELQDWDELQVNATVPPDTGLTATFRSISAAGEVRGTDSFTVESGLHNYSLSVPETEDARVHFTGSSSNVTRSWEVNSYKVFYHEPGAVVRAGDRIPFSDVVVSDRPSVLLGRYGNYTKIENRVAIWR